MHQSSTEHVDAQAGPGVGGWACGGAGSGGRRGTSGVSELEARLSLPRRSMMPVSSFISSRMAAAMFLASSALSDRSSTISLATDIAVSAPRSKSNSTVFAGPARVPKLPGELRCLLTPMADEMNDKVELSRQEGTNSQQPSARDKMCNQHI